MTNPSEDLPPSYSQADQEDKQPPSFDSAISHRLPRPEIPKDVPTTSVHAPLSLTESSKDIRSYFLVDVVDIKSGPDVSLKNTHGAIISQIFLIGSVPRRVSIVAESKYGLIRLAVADRLPGQGIEVEVVAGAGDIFLAVPNDFDGTIVMTNSRSKIDFRPFMALDATEVKDTKAGSSKSVKYRIRPRAIFRAFGEQFSPPAVSPADTIMDECGITASRGKVVMGYHAEFAGPNDNGWDISCSVS